MVVMTTTDTGESGAPQAQETPWKTTQQAATYAVVHYDTILKACREFELTSGKSGLKSIQRGTYATRRIHVDDLVRWMAGQAPSKGTRRPHAA